MIMQTAMETALERVAIIIKEKVTVIAIEMIMVPVIIFNMEMLVMMIF